MCNSVCILYDTHLADDVARTCMLDTYEDRLKNDKMILKKAALIKVVAKCDELSPIICSSSPL